MKKILITVFILTICIPAWSKGNKDFELQTGVGQKDIVKMIGKPDVITQDYDNVETWIYKDIKKIPTKEISGTESIEHQKQSSMLTIKFDDTYRVKNFGYITTYFGENND